MTDRENPHRSLATSRAVKTLKIIVLLALVAAAGWWLTSEPSEYERAMWCMDLGRCDDEREKT